MRYREIISEKAIGGGKSTSPSSLPGYFAYINNALKQNQPLQVGQKGESVIQPNPGQSINSVESIIKGEMNGEQTQIAVKQLFKSQEMHAFGKGKAVEETLANRGEITEGLFAIAVLAKLTHGRTGPVAPDDLYYFINQLPMQGPAQKAWTSPEPGTGISDTFALTVALNPATYDSFRDTAKIAKMMPKEVGAVIDYVNDKSMDRYTQYFAANQRPDLVHVIADGISDQTGTKVDVMMHYKDEQGTVIKQNFDLSVKVGGVAQMGQVGGGASKETLENRFPLLQGLWEKFGVDISPVATEFAQSKDIVDAYWKAYGYAERLLQTQLAGSTYEKESKELQQFIDGIKYFATLNDDRVKLVQFTQKGYYVLDFRHLRKLYGNNDIDLDVRTKSSGKNKLPLLEVYDKESNTNLLTIRMYMTGAGYVRNYIEKGELLKKLTTVRTSIKKKK